MNSYQNQEPMDCPICMDVLDITNLKNIVSTECGHMFHTNCLMKNAAHNGFGCPCCRTVMAEELNDDDSDTENDDDDADDDDDFENFEESEEENALRGLRFMQSRLENDPEYVLDDDNSNETDTIINTVGPPSVEYVMNHMNEYGITTKMLVNDYITALSWFRHTCTPTPENINISKIFTEATEKLFENYIASGDYIDNQISAKSDEKSVRRYDAECLE